MHILPPSGNAKAAGFPGACADGLTAGVGTVFAQSFIMSQSAPSSGPDQRKLTHPLGHIIVLIFTGIFFVFMQRVAYDHTPDVSERWKQILAAYTSVCLSGVFWLCANGFWVTLVDQCRRKKAGIPN